CLLTASPCGGSLSSTPATLVERGAHGWAWNGPSARGVTRRQAGPLGGGVRGPGRHHRPGPGGGAPVRNLGERGGAHLHSSRGQRVGHGGRGGPAHLRRPHGRQRGVLGGQQRRPAQRAGGCVHPGERGRQPHLRGQDGGGGGVLGRQQQKPVHPDRGHLRVGERGGAAHLRGQDRQHHRLLGRQHLRPVHATNRLFHLHRGQRRRLPHLR